MHACHSAAHGLPHLSESDTFPQRGWARLYTSPGRERFGMRHGWTEARCFPPLLEASAASLSTRLVSHAITGSQIALHPFGQAQRRQVDERCDRRASVRALQRLFTARELLEQRLALRHAQGIAEHDGAPARLGG